MEKISRRILSVRSNTGETPGSSREGSASRDSSGRLVDLENISPRIAPVRSNTGETPGSRPLQRQEDALMVPNPRENSRRGSASRDSSGRLAKVEKISQRIVSVRSNTGENPGSRPLQCQEDALMAPNPRENSRGEALPETALEGWRMWTRFPEE